ncbi:MAG: hypothetical protein ACLP3C_29900 [Mycobacterium sp.]|uniref:hypothetical protein n=1 Tax=Mycobacterium sp. TaxID=1785 RepID=UPI003F9C0DD8
MIFSSHEDLVMRALRSDFADPTILVPDLIRAGAPSARRCDVEDLDGRMGNYCPCADCGGCHAGVCGAQVRFILYTLGATAVIVAMFVLALMGVIRYG